jgi:hypothetical protein
LRGRPSFSLQDSPTQLWRLKVALGILSQSAFVITKKPFPLQALCPLQTLLADLQALWPLHALAPMQ